jgi:hypothetical protein
MRQVSRRQTFGIVLAPVWIDCTTRQSIGVSAGREASRSTWTSGQRQSLRSTWTSRRRPASGVKKYLGVVLPPPSSPLAFRPRVQRRQRRQRQRPRGQRTIGFIVTLGSGFSSGSSVEKNLDFLPASGFSSASSVEKNLDFLPASGFLSASSVVKNLGVDSPLKRRRRLLSIHRASADVALKGVERQEELGLLAGVRLLVGV